jgi:DNA-binding Lrp family transcriptional regulator
MLAYLMITLNCSREQEVYNLLKNMPEIKEVHILFGEWDLIALVEVESTEHLGTFVIEKIRSLPEVELTSTMIVAK